MTADAGRSPPPPGRLAPRAASAAARLRRQAPCRRLRAGQPEAETERVGQQASPLAGASGRGSGPLRQWFRVEGGGGARVAGGEGGRRHPRGRGRRPRRRRGPPRRRPPAAPAAACPTPRALRVTSTARLVLQGRAHPSRWNGLGGR